MVGAWIMVRVFFVPNVRFSENPCKQGSCQFFMVYEMAEFWALKVFPIEKFSTLYFYSIWNNLRFLSLENCFILFLHSAQKR